MLLIGYSPRSVPSGDCATRSGSISPTGGSAGLASKRQCRTIRRSRSTATALPWKRRVSAGVRERGGDVHEGRAGRGEGFAIDANVLEADASRYQRVEGSEVDWSDEQKARRPVREYLAALESENAPVNPGQAPKAMSPSDPAAAWTTRGRHKVQFAYSVNHLVDLLDGVIVDVEATPTGFDGGRCGRDHAHRVEAASTSSPSGLLPISPMARSNCSARSSRATSRRTSPCGTKASATTAPSHARTSGSSQSAIFTSALAATFSKPPARCMTAGPCSTGRANTTAIPAR